MTSDSWLMGEVAGFSLSCVFPFRTLARLNERSRPLICVFRSTWRIAPPARESSRSKEVSASGRVLAASTIFVSAGTRTGSPIALFSLPRRGAGAAKQTRIQRASVRLMSLILAIIAAERCVSALTQKLKR
jgi:hypothetical protein